MDVVWCQKATQIFEYGVPESNLKGRKVRYVESITDFNGC